MEHRPGRRRGRRGALGDRPDHPEQRLDARRDPRRGRLRASRAGPRRCPGADGVFAIGDVAATDPLRSSARNFTFKLLARNVRAHLDGRPLKTFTPPKRRWGSVNGYQDDGLVVFTAQGQRFRIPRLPVDRMVRARVVDRGYYRGSPPLIWIDAPRCSESSCRPARTPARRVRPEPRLRGGRTAGSRASRSRRRSARSSRPTTTGTPTSAACRCTPRSENWLSHMSTDRGPAPRLRAVVRRRAQLRHPDHRGRQAPQEGEGSGSTTAPRATRSATRSATTPRSRAAAARTATSTRSSSTSRSASSTRSSTPGSRTGSGRAARAPSGR